MILLEGNMIFLNGGTTPIKDWSVWFRIPTGLCSTLQEAVLWCQDHDMNPDLMIVPVPVANGTDGTYEAVSR